MRAFSDYRVAMALIAACALTAIFLSPDAIQLSEWRTLLVALLAASISQALIDWAAKRPVAFSDGATVSGLIIGAVLSPDTPLLSIVLIAALAMLGKRLIRYRNIPVFNPAGLGLLVGTVLLGTHNAWWAGMPSPPLLPLLLFSILFISWKLRKLLLQFSFAAAWLLLWSAALFSSGQPIAPSFFLTLTPFFLMAFMLIEHTTSPSQPPRRQAAYGILVALLGFLLIQSSLPVEGVLLALLAGNALKKILIALTPEKTSPVQPALH